MKSLAEIIDTPTNHNLNNIFFNKLQSINTDSRSIKEGQIFLALEGKSFDGHDHIAEALEKGAVHVITHKEINNIEKDKLCLVENTLKTYHQLASLYIKTLNPLVIAVTGSSGKTTTKEILVKVLSKKFKVHATEKNFNNEIGVPKTILEMSTDTEILILEMGMRGIGEISLLSKTGRPNIALITNIGSAHIERLGSIENIRKAKLEIIDGLESYHGWRELNMTLIVDEDNYKKLKETGKELPKNTLSFNSEAAFKLNTLRSSGLNADVNAVAKIASLLGLTEKEIQEGILEYSPEAGRGKITKDQTGNIIIDDSYNANPESVRNSIEALITEFQDKKKIAVIGEIAESQPELVDELFQELSHNSSIEIIDARKREISEIKKELEEKLDGNSVVLVKASRSAGLERLLMKGDG